MNIKKQKRGKLISIIIVYFNGFNELQKLLKSIKRFFNSIEYEVIVVDNSNEIKLKKLLIGKPFTIYKKSPGNIGYGKGNNLGANIAKGEYLFFVNPDTQVISGSILKLLSIFKRNKDVAIVAPNLVDNKHELFEKQGTKILTPIRAIFSLTIFSKIFPNNPISSNYYLKDLSQKADREVDVVPGSAFLIRKEVFKRLSGFDKKFFLYFEETDLCKRVWNMGYKAMMSPELVLSHDWNDNEGTFELKKIFRKSRFYYFRKHYGISSAVVVEFFARISKNNLLLFLFIIMALVLLI